ncbi:hypothetical protein F5B19DRAFT_501723 [Rostrohypoxylon terebratum]|nr:hypothetical protein F5B19DRAFT_501723 [Rostrohypoxylon terebratum]
MGTRNLICIRVNRKWALAKYCQWDGYPTGQGFWLYKFLHIEGNIARLRAGLPHIYEPTEEDWKRVTREVKDEMTQIDSLSPKEFDDYLDDGERRRMRGMPFEHKKCIIIHEDKQSDKLFPSLSRGTGAGILELIANATPDNKLPVQSELDFANDGFSCEWAYIVDLDEEQLKIFTCTGPKSEGHPFEDVGDPDDGVPAFVTSFTFLELRSWDKKKFMQLATEIEQNVAEMVMEDDFDDGDEGDSSSDGGNDAASKVEKLHLG